MKTFDASSAAMNRVSHALSKYPAGSVSKRDVVVTIPMEYDEDRIRAVDAAVTAAIYSAAEDFVRARPPENHPGKLTFVDARDRVSRDTRAESESNAAELTARVVRAATSASLHRSP